MVAKRERFEREQPGLEPARLIFVDESGFRLGGSPRYGWAPRGEDAPGAHVQGTWEHVTMLGALALDGWRGFMTVDAGTGHAVFEAFVEHELAPSLRPGDVVVMDNLSAHKGARVRARIEAQGATVVFTPPCSPEYNPIEKAWGKLKDIIRRSYTLTREAFDDAVAAAMEQITASDIRGWAEHCGYNFSLT